MLTATRIQEHAYQRDVRALAVMNFLGTLQGLTQDHALANLAMDARSYGWNSATVEAIRTGILEHFTEI